MDTSDFIRLILLGVMLLVSAFFSASEASFLSVQRGRLHAMQQRGEKGADSVARLVGRPEKLLPTVLTGNNLANVAAASLATTLATSFLSPNWAILAATGGVTVLLLVFAETLPKTIAANNAERLAILVVRPLRVAQLLFLPVVWLLERLSVLVLGIFSASRSSAITEEEIRSLIAIADSERILERSEADMLSKVFHFGDRRVREVMTPRTDIVWLERGTPLREFLGIYTSRTHSRFPVFEGNQETVAGILFVKDLFEDVARGTVQPVDSVTKVLRPVYYVPETKLIAQLFDEMREKGQQMAIAVDQHGGVAGLVTLIQLLEVIVGLVGEEGEPIKDDYTQLSPNSYLVSAGISIHEANEKLGMLLPEGEYQTLAGFILKELGRIPQAGDHFKYGAMELEVKEMRRVKIEQVEVRWLERAGDAST
jgi:CBS domain containing-hemolysin-like protein